MCLPRWRASSRAEDVITAARAVADDQRHRLALVEVGNGVACAETPKREQAAPRLHVSTCDLPDRPAPAVPSFFRCRSFEDGPCDRRLALRAAWLMASATQKTFFFADDGRAPQNPAPHGWHECPCEL